MEKFITRYLPVTALIFTLIGLPAALILINQSQDIRQRAASSMPVTPTPTPSSVTTLGFNSSFDPGSITPNQVFTVELVVETPLPVSAVSAVVKYDPSKLEAQNINLDGGHNLPPLIFSPNSNITTQTINNTTGTISYTILNPPEFQSSGYGSIGEVTFKAKGMGITALAYDFAQTAISAKGYGSSNMLNRVMPMTFTIADTTLTPTPTQSPTPTPTPTSTPNPVSLYDLNGDNSVDVLDYALFIPQFGQTGNLRADFDRDGDVDIFDYNLFVENFGLNLPTPTPTMSISTPTPTTSPTPTPQATSTCGDGICQSITCSAIGCPQPETAQNCPQDCAN